MTEGDTFFRIDPHAVARPGVPDRDDGTGCPTVFRAVPVPPVTRTPEGLPRGQFRQNGGEQRLDHAPIQ